MIKGIRMAGIALAALVFVLIALPLGARAFFHVRAAGRVYADVKAVPPTHVALVLGAGLHPRCTTVWRRQWTSIGPVWSASC